MKGSALLFMILSWLIIWGLLVFCFTLLFTKGEEVIERFTSKREEFADDEEEIT